MGGKKKKLGKIKVFSFSVPKPVPGVPGISHGLQRDFSAVLEDISGVKGVWESTWREGKSRDFTAVPGDI